MTPNPALPTVIIQLNQFLKTDTNLQSCDHVVYLYSHASTRGQNIIDNNEDLRILHFVSL